MARRLAAIMFTDIAGYTSLAQADEGAALRLLQEQEKLIRPLLAVHQGRKVKSIGDGLLLEFEDALDAVECGVEFQRQVHERNLQGGMPPLQIRVGIHLGDVQRRGRDILGDAVNIASRIEPLAEPGGVCISEHVFAQVRNKVAYPFEKLGPKDLKGVREPIDVYHVGLPWAAGEKPLGGPAPPRLAVLPLMNMSPDPTDEFFADGLTEELISTISKVRDLSVISRTSVMQYKGHPRRVAEIARELGVGTILEGSVRRAGNKVRITVQLIDPVADRHLWAENYDRNLEDIFSIQSEVAQKVASALEVRLRGEDEERIGRIPTEVTEAHLLYMKGRFHFQRVSKEGFLTALSYFEQAIQKDPRYALAHAAIAETYGNLAAMDMMPSNEASPKAEAAAKKALELDSGLAEAHISLSYLFLHSSWGMKRALSEAARAVELNPSLPEARLRAGMAYAMARRDEEARSEAQRALELDPLSSHTMTVAATVYLYTDRPERAAELFEKVMEGDPTNSFARNNLGLSYVREGKYDEGIAEIRKAIELSRGSNLGERSDLAYALARAGRTEEARRVADELVTYYREHGVGAESAGYAFASVGDRDAAFEWLERARRERSAGLVGVLANFCLDPVRDDPRYRELLKKMGLPLN